VIDCWRAGAPSLDFIAPDIYTDEFTWVCNEYTLSGNPLFIPETRGGKIGAARAFYAIGQFSAACFAAFGIDGRDYASGDPLDGSYAVLQNLAPIILENQGNDSMRGILVDTAEPAQNLDLGNYRIKAKIASNKCTTVAGGLIIQTGPDEFIVAGQSLDIYFKSKDSTHRTGIISVDEGYF
jgi:hypothetical protein